MTLLPACGVGGKVHKKAVRNWDKKQFTNK